MTERYEKNIEIIYHQNNKKKEKDIHSWKIEGGYASDSTNYKGW